MMKMSNGVLCIGLTLSLVAFSMAPDSSKKKISGLSVSSDSALIPYTVTREEYEALETQLFTYQQIAAIRKKHIDKLTQKLAAISPKDSDGKDKRKKIRIKVKKKKSP